MLQVIGFVLVIALVFAIKAVVIVKSHDDLAAQSASFSWMSARPQDVAVAESWSVAEEAAVSEASVPLGNLRPAGA